jgi:hypothetical protein
MTSKSLIGAIAGAVIAVGALAAGGSAQATAYAFVTIDGPASPNLLATVVNGVNNHGLATGYYILAGDPSMGQQPTNYIGFTVQANGSGFASFVRSGYQQTGASGINDAGDIVGVSVLTNGLGSGFLRAPGGTFTDIDPALGGLPSVYSEAIGINGAGSVVGYFTSILPPNLNVIQDYSHGFILSGGVYTQFDVPAALGFGTQLYSMNSSGMITGSFLDNTYGLPHGFLYSPSTGLSVPGFSFVSAVGGVDEAGDFTYTALSYDPLSPLGYDAAAYRVTGGVYDPIAVPGAFSTQAQGLNDRGQVTGVYLDATGVHGFIATPVPEPRSWALMLIGLGALGAGLRRRRAASPRFAGLTQP